MGYLELIADNKHILSFTYKCGRGNFTIDLNNAVEMFAISDFKKFFSIADESAEGSFTIAEKVQAFTACRLEYEKSFLNGTFSKNQKLIAKLEKILVFLADSFGISCDIEKPEKVTKKRGTGIIINIDNSGTKTAEAVTGDFYKIGGIWYFIHKKPEIKRGGYVLSAAAYGARVASFGYFKTAKEAIAWIQENNISEKLKTVSGDALQRAHDIRKKFVDTIENCGLSWIIEKTPEFFKDFLTEENAEKKAKEKTAEKAETAETKKRVYVYGMRLRGYSVGCQPTGVIERKDDETGKYHDIIIYDRPLTADEIKHFSLDDLTLAEQPEKQTAYIDHIGVQKVKRLYMYKTFRKAPEKSKYNVTRAYSKSPYAVYLQKIGFQVMKYPYTDHKAKISMCSGKTLIGFHTGVSPP